MPTKTHYLNDSQTEIVTITWGLFYRKFELLYNGQSLGQVPNLNKEPNGTRYPLPDGRVLTARLIRSQGLQELELLLDGQPLPGSATHPRERLKQAWYTLLFVGGLNIVLGAAAGWYKLPALERLGLGWESIIVGVIFLVLGWLGYTRRSILALTTALALFVLDSLLTLGGFFIEGRGPGLGGLFIRFFFGVMIFRGIKGAKQLRDEQKAAATE
ncbi:hypothetical protein [Hymenobacter sp.]|uniref:hypothetical protein n=1 Tax=Hymenobacter sp. TaxID=1898978 RepID=UPI00286CC431|nr:hypothetical protein [Hymenobacter sp.]